MAAILDASGKVSGAAALAAGYEGVARYLSAFSDAISPLEFAADIKAGATVVLAYEDGAQDGLGGAATGLAHGKIAAQELAGLGLAGESVVVYFAVDFDIQPAQYDLAATCLAAFQLASGAVAAPYGPRAFVNWWMAQHPSYGWVAAGWESPGGTPAQIIQQLEQVVVGGVTCDVDTVSSADYGQWPRWIPEPPLVVGAETTVLIPFTFTTDANGDGWTQTDVLWTDFRAVTINGTDPAVDGGYPRGAVVLAQDRNGTALIEVVGWVPNSTVTVNVAAASN